MKKVKIRPFSATRMDLEITILTEVRQRQTSYNIAYTWNPKKKKNDTCEFFYKIETDSQTQKTNLWLPKGKGVGGDKLGLWN